MESNISQNTEISKVEEVERVVQNCILFIDVFTFVHNFKEKLLQI